MSYHLPKSKGAVPLGNGGNVYEAQEPPVEVVVAQVRDSSSQGGGVLYGELLVNVTLQGYDGTNENKAKVTELIGKQAAVAEQAL